MVAYQLLQRGNLFIRIVELIDDKAMPPIGHLPRSQRFCLRKKRRLLENDFLMQERPQGFVLAGFPILNLGKTIACVASQVFHQQSLIPFFRKLIHVLKDDLVLLTVFLHRLPGFNQRLHFMLAE
jgi:hypothetical protein